MSSRIILPSYVLHGVHAILLWFMISYGMEAATTNSNETDRLALLELKSQIIQDPLQVMSSWNDSLRYCEWQGVTCGTQHRRVVKLDLQSNRLVGTLSPYIGNLTFLRSIHLQDNGFRGEIPPEVGRLFRLQHFNMTNNSLVGEIPTNLSHCSDLQTISLLFNQLVGTIPTQFGSLSKLLRLSLFSNRLTGGIPPSLGNLSNLQSISLGSNSLDGTIPDSLGQLKNLVNFRLGVNQLSGMVPRWLFNLSSLAYIVIPSNNFSGSLPPNIAVSLPNLLILAIAENQFTGPIPTSLSNASGLRILDIAENNFVGPVPTNLGGLQHLWFFSLDANHLGQKEGDDLTFLTSLTNCSNLMRLGLGQSNFGGVLPNSVVNLSSKLEILDLGGNQIVGSIPIGFENLVSLNYLGLEHNFFVGGVPDGIGKLRELRILGLYDNTLTGKIPSSLGNLTQLYELKIGENKLVGSIPLSLENCIRLEKLDLSQNNLSGSIPKGVSSHLIYLDLANNYLTGSIPVEVGSLKNLEQLNVSENKLSGRIPTSIGNCLSLEQLYMQGNSFEGNIPTSLSSLRGIRHLDLSRNKFSGEIPKDLEALTNLQSLNLSHNYLEGEVPSKGIFKNASAISLSGNNKLCSGIPELQLSLCSMKDSAKTRKPIAFYVILPIVGVLCLMLMFCIFLYRKRKRKKPVSTLSLPDQHLRISYGELLKATDGFSETNLIGTGTYGTVYKGVLEQDETIVAVKVFNMQQQRASKSFKSECKALRNIRHRNLLKLLTSCSSVDYQGNDFKALVFEFMPNGSLERWLHPSVDEQHLVRNLNLIERLHIAIDVASALDYLHHRCQTTIVHSDLKPSNVLLDGEMTAHVGDFGLAKIVSNTSNISGQLQSDSVAIKGSIGYVAPEYGFGGEMSTRGDVYSYGILLLEMFTKKRPTNEMFKDGFSLHNFAKTALPERAMEIIDEQGLFSEDGHDEPTNTREHQRDRRRQTWECLVSVLRIGVACSVESPTDRMEIKDVLVKLCFIRDVYQGVGFHANRQHRTQPSGEGTSYLSGC